MSRDELGTWEADGPSTRAVTIRGGDPVRFAPEALEDMADQVRAKFIPVSSEHLTYLPPLGRLVDAEVRDTADGERRLVFIGQDMRQLIAADEAEAAFKVPLDDVDGAGDPGELAVKLGAEPRNFEPAKWDEVSRTAPLPLDEHHKWAELPPLEWLIWVPVTWGATKFAGSFLEALGKEAAAGLVDWLRDASRRARANKRTRFVTLAFDLGDGREVLGFVPFEHDDDQMVHVRRALDSAGELAAIAGAQGAGLSPRAERIAYLYADGTWRLAWFVMGMDVVRTEHFLKAMPDPKRFLEGEGGAAEDG